MSYKDLRNRRLSESTLRGWVLDRSGQLDHALALYRRLGDTLGILVALRGCAATDVYRGDYTSARRRLEVVLALCRALDDRPGIAATLGELGYVARLQGDQTSAESSLEEALVLSRRMGHMAGVVVATPARGAHGTGSKRRRHLVAVAVPARLPGQYR